jgi:hypothetical protein
LPIIIHIEEDIRPEDMYNDGYDNVDNKYESTENFIVDNNWQDIIKKNDNKVNKVKKSAVLRPISARNINNKNDLQKYDFQNIKRV